MTPYDLTKAVSPIDSNKSRSNSRTSVHAVAAHATMIGRPKLVLASGSPAESRSSIRPASSPTRCVLPTSTRRERGELRAPAPIGSRAPSRGRARLGARRRGAPSAISSPRYLVAVGRASCPSPSWSMKPRNACACSPAAIIECIRRSVWSPRKRPTASVGRDARRFKRLSRTTSRPISPRVNGAARPVATPRKHRRKLHRQDRGLLQQRRRPSTLRGDHAFVRRRLPDPCRLAQRRYDAWYCGSRSPYGWHVRARSRTTSCPSAASRPGKISDRFAAGAAPIGPQRWFSGVYAVPIKEEEDEDGVPKRDEGS